MTLSRISTGIRGVGFVSSPLLARSGAVNEELVHITDWLPTFLHLAGSDASHLSLDGVNQWESISTGTTRSREVCIHSLLWRRLHNSSYSSYMFMDNTEFWYNLFGSTLCWLSTYGFDTDRQTCFCSALQEILINIDELELSSHDRSQSTLFDTRIQAALRWMDWKLITGDPGYSLWVPAPQNDYSLCRY